MPPSSQVKIAFVIGALGVGGAERQLLKKIVLLKELGLDVFLVTLAEGGRLTDDYRRAGCRLYELPREHSFELRRVRRLAEILRAEKPDVVHGEQYNPGAYARLAGWMTGVPVKVHAIRSAYPRIRKRYRIAEFFLRRITDAYMVNASAIKERTIAIHGIAPERIHVILNVYDADASNTPARTPGEVRRELSLPDDAPVIGIVASLEPEKNHALFVEFAARLHRDRPDVRFLVIGDGPRRAATDARVHELGLGDVIHFLGTRRDVPDLLQVLDVSVNCSVREGLCNAIIESIAAGVPVLASRVGGTPEIVTEGVQGELFTSNDVDGMLASFATLAGDLDGYRARSAGARAAFLSNLEGKRIARQMRDIYLDCLERRGRLPANARLEAAGH